MRNSYYIYNSQDRDKHIHTLSSVRDLCEIVRLVDIEYTSKYIHVKRGYKSGTDVALVSLKQISS